MDVFFNFALIENMTYATINALKFYNNLLVSNCLIFNINLLVLFWHRPVSIKTNY